MTIGPLPVCFQCARLVEFPHCTAFGFETEIPDIIAAGMHDHKTPVPGDHGLLFKQADAAELKGIRKRHNGKPSLTQSDEE